MRRLCSRVNDHRDILSMAREHVGDGAFVADIGIDVTVARDALLEMSPGRLGRRRGAEEITPHVVVDADDVQAVLREQAGRLRANEPRRASDDGNAHAATRCGLALALDSVTSNIRLHDVSGVIHRPSAFATTGPFQLAAPGRDHVAPAAAGACTQS